MQKLELRNNKKLKLLCIGAHSDDIEIGCGGSILKILEKYDIASVFWIVFSSDDIRKKEAEESAGLFLKDAKNKIVKIESYRDGFLHYSGEEIKEIFEGMKKSFNPDLIFTHNHNDGHQDHRLLSELTWNTFRNHMILEYEIPKYDGDFGRPNFFIPLEEKRVNRKNEIILNCFKSQINKHWFCEDLFNSVLRIRGMESASMYSEAFYARKISF